MSVTVDTSLHPQVTAVLRGAHVLHPAPDLSDEERRFIEFAREADRRRTGLPDALSGAERELVDHARVDALSLAESVAHATSHLTTGDLAHVPRVVKEVMAEHGISQSLIERTGWEWLHDALAK